MYPTFNNVRAEPLNLARINILLVNIRKSGKVPDPVHVHKCTTFSGVSM